MSSILKMLHSYHLLNSNHRNGHIHFI